MSSKQRYPSYHDDPRGQRLRAIVSAFVPEGPGRQAYLAFARELMRAQRRSARPDGPEFRNQRAESRVGESKPPRAPSTPRPRRGHPQITQTTQMTHGHRTEGSPPITQIPQIGVPALQTGNWKLGTATTRPFPDYSRRTKLVVMRWFKRGLSGHLLRLVGQAAIREARMTKPE